MSVTASISSFIAYLACLLSVILCLIFSFKYKAESIIALGTLILALATGVLAFEAYRQITITTEELTSVQRAFVTPRELTFLWHYDEMNKHFWWEMAPIWENSGTTPTRDMRINVNSYFEATRLPDNFQFPLAVGLSVPLFIGPKATASGDAIIKRGEELLAIKRYEKFLYIWGCAKYRDIFEGTSDHLTKFAWQVSITGDPTSPQDSGNIVRYFTNLLPHHNCLDQECEREDQQVAESENMGYEGGCVAEATVWKAPAKSGYEIAQRRLGLPVDPYLRQFGRGGAVSGYEPKLAIIEQLRASYFAKYSKRPETVFENINAVPLDYLNHELMAKGEIWRVRIVDNEYEFYIPNPR